jgi:membrane-associated phospholipid phosphatase
METLQALEIQWITLLQGWLRGTQAVFNAITLLGSEDFFILVMPALYWCVDAALGLRVGMILMLSGHFNGILKVIFHLPRPYWVSADVQPGSAEASFGMPSGHAMNTLSIWGLTANLLAKRWFSWLAAVVILLVGFSRVVLGMHFISDVAAGWLLGGLLLFMFIKLNRPVTDWLKRLSTPTHILLAVVSTLFLAVIGLLPTWFTTAVPLPADWLANAARASSELPNPYDISGSFTTAGTWLGMTLGVALLYRLGGQKPTQNNLHRLLRYIIGLVGLFLFWYGLKLVFPDGETWLPLALRLLRYTLVGLWIGLGAPLVFHKLRLFTPAND